MFAFRGAALSARGVAGGAGGLECLLRETGVGFLCALFLLKGACECLERLVSLLRVVFGCLTSVATLVLDVHSNMYVDMSLYS